MLFSLYLPSSVLMYLSLSISPNLCGSFSLSLSLSFFTHLSIGLSVYLPVFLSVSLSRPLSLCIHPSVYLSIHLKGSNYARFPLEVEVDRSKTKQFCEASTKKWKVMSAGFLQNSYLATSKAKQVCETCSTYKS